MKKIFIKEPAWIAFLKPIARVFARIKWGYKVKGKYKAAEGENIFVLSNHQTDLDPVLVRLSVNRFLYTIATDNIFSDPKTVKWLTRFGAIPKKKGIADLRSIFTMTTIANSGGSILLFPEGNRSYAEFQFYIADNFGKLLKNLKCTIVLFNLHGGFGSLPRFGSKKRRKGPFYGEIKRVMKYEEYENMPIEELTQIVKENLWAHVPREVKITTNASESGSGPKNELNTPLTEETLSSVIADKPSSEPVNPPLIFNTAIITTTIPNSIIMP